jgi:hypothetical protein
MCDGFGYEVARKNGRSRRHCQKFTHDPFARRDCDCTTVEWPRQTFRPGERGTLTARFDLEESGGKQRKRLYVIVSNHPDQPVVLTVEIVSPKIAEIEPRVLLWDETNLGAPKSLVVHVDDETSIRHLAVQTDSSEVTAALNRVGPRLYRINLKVRPQHRPAAVAVTLTIETATVAVNRTATVVLR